jgi:SAM-dependent methyltransferase
VSDQFINIELNYETLDKYHIRSSIFESIANHAASFKGKLLDVGCGKMPYKHYILTHSFVEEYIGIDLENALVYDRDIKPDTTWNGIIMPFDQQQFETIIATEVLEHCPNPLCTLKEIYRVMKPGGIFFFTVPFLWNLHEVPNDEYRYTPFALKRLLHETGFTNIQIQATGGWHASLAQMLGLWARRSPITKSAKRYAAIALKPVIRYLLKKDKAHQITFKEGQMITGFYGICGK